MSRTDFIFSIGFQGNTAIINKRMKTQAKGTSWEALLEQGYLRPAFSAALWDEEREEKPSLEAFVKALSKELGRDLTLDEIKRMFGVFFVPDDKVKTLAL